MYLQPNRQTVPVLTRETFCDWQRGQVTASGQRNPQDIPAFCSLPNWSMSLDHVHVAVWASQFGCVALI